MKKRLVFDYDDVTVSNITFCEVIALDHISAITDNFTPNEILEAYSIKDIIGGSNISDVLNCFDINDIIEYVACNTSENNYILNDFYAKLEKLNCLEEFKNNFEKHNRSDLPDEYTQKDVDDLCVRYLLKSKSHSIFIGSIYAFDWRKSKEGYRYWRDVYDKL